MTKVVFVSPAGESQSIDVLPGLTLMEAAVQNGIVGIDGDCGGSCNCGTCHVWIDEAWLSKLTPSQSIETNMIEGLVAAQPNSRLCCQIKISSAMDGMILRIPSK